VDRAAPQKPVRAFDVFSLAPILTCAFSVSAQACALIYDSALSAKEELALEEAGWRFGFKLKNEHVWDAFLVLALTADCKQQGVCLDVPNGGFQNCCFCEVMRARNERIIH
jgi:hypothetical protein